MSRHSRPGRRSFLTSTASAAGILLSKGLPLRAADDKRPNVLIVREQEPANLEMPFESVDTFLTPTDLFYVRSHFAVPTLDCASWKLEVTGAVNKPAEITFDELVKLPTHTVAVTLECAGNGRQFLDPKVKGVQWGLGAVGTAEWTGVRLARVLEMAGVHADAVDIVLEGADRGEPKNDPKPAGQFPFARSLPVKKVKSRKPEVLLAFQMNGAPLTPAHGFPVRAVVAGWYGMASVKWLRRVVVTDRPFRGYDETVDYAVWDRSAGLPSLTPVTGIEVKASIARPVAGETLSAGKGYRVRGAAWAGESAIARVELSTDGGASWSKVRLATLPRQYAWCLWEYDWRAPQAGKYTLMVRASDCRGRTQPTRRDPDRRGYVINHVIGTPVEVKG